MSDYTDRLGNVLRAFNPDADERAVWETVKAVLGLSRNTPTGPYEYNGYLKPLLPQILEMLKAGRKPQEIRSALGVDYNAEAMIGYIGRKYELLVPQKQPATSDRNLEMLARYNEGERLSALAREYGISGTRASEIVEKTARLQGRRIAMLEAQKTPPGELELLPLAALELPVRVLNCFYEFKTVGDVLQLTEAELLRLPNFGRVSLADWKQCLRKLRRERAEPEVTP